MKCSTIGDDVTPPTTLKMNQKLFFRIAEVKYLLFEPKNSALDAFLRDSEIPPTYSNMFVYSASLASLGCIRELMVGQATIGPELHGNGISINVR